MRDLRWILPASLLVGLALSIPGPGVWWIGWLTFAVVTLLGLVAQSALWRSSGAPKALGWMLILAVALRLGLGMAFSYILPAYGNDTPVQKAGYIFADAYRRDGQSWDLASSSNSLFEAFNKTSSNSDQYGGLLFVSGLAYRLGSPEAHRPWLIILLSALVSGIGVALAYKASRQAWGERVALPVGWIMAVFPEAVLLGSSQMREPFLMTFAAMCLWGLVHWAQDRRSSTAWMIGGVIGLLLFNPGVAVAAVIILAVWMWLHTQARRISPWIWMGVLAVVVLSLILFGLAVSGSTPTQGSLPATLINWLRYTVQWDSSVVERNSGSVQWLFERVPEVLHLPLLISYGMLQPVLPAAIGDIEGVWPMQAVGILRGLGWFALLPFLIYGPVALWKMKDTRERAAWLWLWVAMVIWIILSSARGGGDQWDNPRYRATLLLFQAALAAQVFTLETEARARGLIRLVEVEVVFVICFSAWTFSRYNGDAASLPLGGTFIAFLGISVLCLIGDWVWAKYQGKRKKRESQSMG